MIFGESALLQQLATRAIDQNDRDSCVIKPAYMRGMFSQSPNGFVMRIQEHNATRIGSQLGLHRAGFQ